jgi:hypothetical protein
MAERLVVPGNYLFVFLESTSEVDLQVCSDGLVLLYTDAGEKIGVWYKRQSLQGTSSFGPDELSRHESHDHDVAPNNEY